MSGAAYRLATALLPLLYFAFAASGSKEVPGPAALERRPLRALVGVMTVLLHLALFYEIHVETEVFVLVIPGAALSALALSLFVIYSWVEWQSGVRNLRAPILGSVFVIQLVATGIGYAPVGEPPAASTIFVIHVVTIIASVATLLLSGFFGIIYLIMEKEMRSQRFGPLFARLPKLSELSSMNRNAATAGFLMMTVGLNLGIWQAHASGRKGFSYLDPIVVATMAAWVVFGVIGVSRWVRFLSGRKAAVTAVCGLVLVVLAIAVSIIPGISFHRFS